MKCIKLNLNANRKSFTECRGIILLDIILGLTLATIFIVVISQSYASARDIFEDAKTKNELINQFKIFFNVSTSTTSIISLSTTSTTQYGNDRLQQDVFGFTQITSRDEANINDYDGTPLCSVNFFGHSIVGSYLWNSMYSTTSLVKITPIPLPIDPLLPMTDFQIRNGTAYISIDSNVALDPDIIVVDINNISQPRLISSIDTGPGIRAISLVQNRIYAAAASTAYQLHIIRLDNLANPVLEKKYKLSLPFATATPTRGSSVFYYKNKVFLGTDKWDGEEFSIIDVIQPTTPIKISGFKTNSKINDIWVYDNIAYLAGSDQLQLRTLDIKDSTQIKLIDSFSPSGWSRQEGKSINTFEDNINFGRTSGGYNIISDHELFQFSTTTVSLDISGGVYGIIQDHSHIYVASRETNKEFQIYDSQLATSTVRTFSLPVAPQKITCDGDKIYILAGTAPVIYQVSFN